MAAKIIVKTKMAEERIPVRNHVSSVFCILYFQNLIREVAYGCLRGSGNFR